MIDLYLLEELVTFYQTGTLAATATQLHVTQPTITRGMQKLENLLDVRLFQRQPNRITLTPAGQFAAKRAQSVLAVSQQFSSDVRHFAQQQQHLIVECTLPGPFLVLKQVTQPQFQMNTELQPITQIKQRLAHYQATVIFSNQNLVNDLIASQAIGIEQLAVNLDQFMLQANQTTITFQELRGLNFIVLANIGPWRTTIQQNIPEAHFLYQQERAAMATLTQYSNFPYFTTNLSALDSTITPQADQICLPIRDASAQMTIYANYLSAEATRVTPLLKAVQANWPNRFATTL